MSVKNATCVVSLQAVRFDSEATTSTSASKSIGTHGNASSVAATATAMETSSTVRDPSAFLKAIMAMMMMERTP